MHNLLSSFRRLEDPRIERTKDYSLESIIFITICAVVSGSNTWVSIEDFGKTKHQWLSKYIKLPKDKSPCDDVYSDFFKRIDTEKFTECFINWTEQISGLVREDLIAIDGKTLRGSYDRSSCKESIHMISAWSQSNQLVLGQYKTHQKSNEITAIPALLDLLDISGSVISIDAMGCQRTIAKQIINQNADYILGLKGNQEVLLDDTKYSFRDISPCSDNLNITKDHGRIEKRNCSIITNLKHLENRQKWEGLQSIICIQTQREELSTGKISKEKRYYISSLKVDAKKFNQYIRSHWQIENKLHWVLDVTFKEDLNRTRTGHADANFNIIRHIALNILKLDKSKTSLNRKRYKAALNDLYRQNVMKI